jgi:hypothetical protein
MIVWLAFAAIILSAATVLWFPCNPALDEIYLPQGWLTAWYGFNLFSASSPAFDRSLQILGIFGVINLILGLWLIVRCNHIVGWLTLMPVFVFALPCFALPFTNALAARSTEDIEVYHRMLLAVPMGLAFITCMRGALGLSPKEPNGETSDQTLSGAAAHAQWPTMSASRFLRKLLVASGPTAVLAGVVLLPAGKPSYNRFWQSIQITPEDLTLRQETALVSPKERPPMEPTETLTISHPIVSEVSAVFQPDPFFKPLRMADVTASTAALNQALELLQAVAPHFAPLLSHQLTPNPSLLLLCNRVLKQPGARLIAKPTSTNIPWITLGGDIPRQEQLLSQRQTISNSTGKISYPFNPELIPISRFHRYRVECLIRQSGSTEATNYLAIAWYDHNGKLLESNLASPLGAGNPPGWNNGTFSYFGLIGRPAPDAWARYTFAFGVGETAAIPPNASFLRIGALLNFNGKPNANVSLTDVRLLETPLPSNMLLLTPNALELYSSYSPAAFLSGHWSPQKVPASFVGSAEMRLDFH